ncbi:LPS translocon maturation chaperone LptM [Methyloprofundus sp.]
MTSPRLLIVILFSVVLNACGQQGPLFMPIENESIDEQTIDNSKQEAGVN